MWVLTPENDILPADPAPLAVLSEGVALPMLAIADYQSHYLESDLVTQDWEPETATVEVEAPVDDVVTLTLPEGLDSVDVVTIGGVTYQPAAYPLVPQPGEFVAIGGGQVQIQAGTNAGTGIVYAIAGGSTARVQGRTAATITNTVDPHLMECFSRINAVGEFSWSLTSEGHPSGSLTLLILGGISLVRDTFLVGEEFTFAGIGFSIGSYAETLKNTAEFPGGLYEVSIGLKGKWEAQQYTYPVRITPDSGSSSSSGSLAGAGSRCFGVRDTSSGDSGGGNSPDLDIDPDCTNVQWTAAQLRNQDNQTSVSVGGLARKISGRAWSNRRRYSAQFSGATQGSNGGNGAWEIPITPETPRDASSTFMAMAESLKRKNRCIIDYSDGSAVVCRLARNSRQWLFSVPSMSISASTPTQNNDGEMDNPSTGSDSNSGVKRIYSSVLGSGSGGGSLSFSSAGGGSGLRAWEGWSATHNWIGVGAEYPNVEVPRPKEEESADKSEDDAVDPRTVRAEWIPREPVRQRVVIDPERASSPPSDARWIESVTVNASQSGITLERVEKFTEDGFPTKEYKTIYGFRFDTFEDGIVTPAKTVTTREGNTFSNQMEYDVLSVHAEWVWRVIEDVETNYIYDDYGYLLKTVSSGYRWLRAKEETEALEAYGIKVDAAGTYDEITTKELNLMRFIRVPMRGETQYLYRMFWDFYLDFEEEPRGQFDKVCNPDGTSSEYWLVNRNWAPAVFQSETLSYESCYEALPNPNDVGLLAGDIKEGDIPLGKESQSRSRVQILPSKNTKSINFDLDGEFTVEVQEDSDSKMEMQDRYLVYTSSDIAMNGSFNDKAVDVQIQTQEGRPQPAQRKPPLFELVKGPKKEEDSENPEDPLTQGQDSSKDKFRYTLTTAGYSPSNDPVQGSTSWTGCETISEIMWAAQIDLEIQDLSSAQFQFETAPNYQARPLDRATVQVNGESWPLRITQIQNRIVIEGGGQYRSSPTKFTAGIDRRPNFSLNKIPTDKSKKSPSSTSLSVYRQTGQTIGDIRPPNLRSRYNVNGDS